MKKLTICYALIACLMCPLTSFAKPREHKPQPETAPVAVTSGGFVDFSSEQLMLNNQAAEATKMENYQKAEGLYQALLLIGEVNIVWHNLGRTYAAENKCLEAFDAFSHVDGAPKMRDLPPEDLHKAKEKAVAELREQCSAMVVMKCNPTDMTLSIDGGREFKCNGQSDPVPIVPGRHSVFGKTDFGFNNVSVNVANGETREYKIDVINYEEVAAKSGATVEALEKRSKLFTSLGWSFVGVGIAAAGFGAFWAPYNVNHYKEKLNICRTQEKRESNSDKCGDWIEDTGNAGKEKDKTDTNQFVGWSLLAGGAALAVTGAVLLIFDAIKIKPQLKELQEMLSVEVNPIFSPGMGGIALSGSF